MDYSLAQFGTSASSETQIIAPSSMRDSTSSTAQKLEATFCRNFSCCDQELEDLHDLLQHYEECHGKCDDFDELAATVGSGSAGSGNGSGSGETPPAMMPDEGSSDETSSSSSPASPSNLAAGGGHHLKHQNRGLLGTASATPMATPNAGSSIANNAGHRKRSFNQFSTTPSASGNSAATASAVHQHLRRALADGGIGGSAAAGIRRAASPFSTPGGSMPGTPAGEPELDGLLGGVGGNSTIGAFSAMSLRSGQFDQEHNLPSCAPPTLFFPANGTTSANGGTGTSTTNQPPHAKRERLNSSSSSVTDCGTSSFGSKDFDPKNVIILPGNVDKPYKCPAAGCDKAYKQMNGLKYHRLHGHCNQNNAPISILQTSQAQLAALAAANQQQQQQSQQSSQQSSQHSEHSGSGGSAANSPTTPAASAASPSKTAVWAGDSGTPMTSWPSMAR